MKTSILLTGSFLATILSGVPIAFLLGIVSFAYLFFIADVSLDIIASYLFSGLNDTAYTGLPFFILTGILMKKTRITDDFIAFADMLVGRLPGSLAQINILVSILFAGISGAAVADTAAMGSILIPMMKKQGYTAEYSAAITTASSVLGPIIPPSAIMVVYGSITGVSIRTLFLAGIIPGLLIGAGLMIMAMFFAIKDKHPRRTEPFVLERARHVIKRAGGGLLLTFIIFTGLLSGIFTASEAAILACLYVLWMGILVLKTLTLRDIGNSIIEASVIASVIFLVIVCAHLFSLVLTSEGIPEKIAEFISWAAGNRYTFLLLVNVLLIFMGMVMESSAIVVVLAPILLPLALNFGIHPIHFSLVMLVNANIGLITPPLGICLFTAAPLAKVSYERIAITTMPFIAMEIAALMLMTYFPDLILFIPRTAGLTV
ncbi:MAG: TRAP transporter large permease [Spirochaetales bacterium]|jgi:tripartite ATP-independent transporter DctM subunit|nr:TRAP transporter large permease [Spirochaetales bacterium]